MKLPVDMMRSSLRAALTLLRAGSDSSVAIDLIQQVHDALAPSSNALRVRKSRASSSITSSGSSSITSTTGQSDPSSSEISSSLSDSAVLDSEKREANPPAAHATGQSVDEPTGQRAGQSTGHVRNAVLAGCWDGVGGVSTGGSQRARIGEVVPLLERLARERNVDPVALFQSACDRFKADEGLKAKRMVTLPVLLSQLEQWVDEAPAMPPRAGSAPPAITPPSRKLLNPPPTKAGAA